MIVVSDASPLISLARIGRLDLLASLFQHILIPTDVHREVTEAGRGRPGAEEIRAARWIEVAASGWHADPELARTCEPLGAGERSAILLAQSLPANLILLDEWKARRIAKSAGLAITGCLGVLEAGARRGFVPDLRGGYIDLLRQGVRFEIRLLQESLIRLGLPEL